jgi:tRNA(fMet)-specific endonuclease VapC
VALFIADTDVLIDFLQGQDEAERVGVELQTGRLCVTVISAFELWAGANNARQMSMVEILLAAVTVLPLDDPAARRAAEIQRKLKQGGESIGMADSLIAGIALEQNAILITRNLKHFQRVPGLKLSGQYQ